MEKTANLKQKKALKLIERFNPAVESDELAFDKMGKADFAASLQKMIEEPASITQGAHPICGVASALKIAGELDPVGLVKMGAHLFAHGVYQMPSFLLKKIKVPKSVQNMKHSNGLSPAEHVLETTIKAFFNPITGYNNNPGSLFNQWQGITFPHQLANFLKDYFKIDRVSLPKFRFTTDELESALNSGISVLAWTSWNQMKKPGERFKLLEQHYVVLKKLERVDDGFNLWVDNPRKNNAELECFKFENATQLKKAVIGIYGFKRAGDNIELPNKVAFG